MRPPLDVMDAMIWGWQGWIPLVRWNRVLLWEIENGVGWSPLFDLARNIASISDLPLKTISCSNTLFFQDFRHLVTISAWFYMYSLERRREQNTKN